MNKEQRPLLMDEDSWLQMRPRTLIALLVATITATAGWLALKSDTTDNTKQITELRSAVWALTEMMSKTQTGIAEMKEAQRTSDWKLDYLTGVRRNLPPKPPVVSLLEP